MNDVFQIEEVVIDVQEASEHFCEVVDGEQN